MTSGGTLNVWMDEGRVTPLLEADIPFLFLCRLGSPGGMGEEKTRVNGLLSSSFLLSFFLPFRVRGAGQCFSRLLGTSTPTHKTTILDFRSDSNDRIDDSRSWRFFGMPFGLILVAPVHRS